MILNIADLSVQSYLIIDIKKGRGFKFALPFLFVLIYLMPIVRLTPPLKVLAWLLKLFLSFAFLSVAPNTFTLGPPLLSGAAIISATPSASKSATDRFTPPRKALV